MDGNRRNFLLTGTLGFGAVVVAQDRIYCEDRAKDQPDEEVGATEDLMREHGVLNRILLVYEEGIRRLRAGEDVPPEVFHRPAMLVRKFVEEYHEKLEEDFIFPEFEKAKKLVELVGVLKEQHQAGRRVTDVILRTATPDLIFKDDSRKKIINLCEAFIRMYRPHEAREDTVVFPTLRKILPAKRLAELGEQFEEQEDKLFGEGGFANTVEQVSVTEKQLGIYDLAQFTPK